MVLDSSVVQGRGYLSEGEKEIRGGNLSGNSEEFWERISPLERLIISFSVSFTTVFSNKLFN